MNKGYYQIIIALLLPLSVAHGEQVGQEYRNWCSRGALTEKLEPDKQDEYIQACIDELVKADKSEDSGRSRRNRRQEDDDR